MDDTTPSLVFDDANNETRRMRMSARWDIRSAGVGSPGILVDEEYIISAVR